MPGHQLARGFSKRDVQKGSSGIVLAALVRSLLERCASLRILVFSRARLVPGGI